MFVRAAAFLIAFALPGLAPAADQGEPAVAEAPAGVVDPVDYVRSTYRQYMAGTAPADPGYAYSPALRALIAAAEREQQDEPGRLDFDFWISGQDWVIETVDVAEEPASDGKRIVTARFANQSVPTLIRFHFVAQGGRWFVDDVENLDGPVENRWRLRQILTEPPIVAFGEGWQIFYRGADGSVAAFHQPPSLKDGILSAEIRVRQWDARNPDSEGRFWIEQDCRKKMSRMLRGQVLEDGKVETRDEPQSWTAIRPDTPAAALSARLCAPAQGSEP